MVPKLLRRPPPIILEDRRLILLAVKLLAVKPLAVRLMAAKRMVTLALNQLLGLKLLLTQIPILLALILWLTLLLKHRLLILVRVLGMDTKMEKENLLVVMENQQENLAMGVPKEKTPPILTAKRLVNQKENQLIRAMEKCPNPKPLTAMDPEKSLQENLIMAPKAKTLATALLPKLKVFLKLMRLPVNLPAGANAPKLESVLLNAAKPRKMVPGRVLKLGNAFANDGPLKLPKNLPGNLGEINPPS